MIIVKKKEKDYRALNSVLLITNDSILIDKKAYTYIEVHASKCDDKG